MRFQRVREILDESVGGPSAPVGAHGAFWRDATREQLVVTTVLGRDLVTVGDGAGSNLVRALKGEAPFGADLAEPPPGASLRRMPAGRPPVPAESIAFIEKWIDDGCPDDVAPEPQPSWRATNAPVASPVVGGRQAGFSSASPDGGKTWRDANEIGRFINRFRFPTGSSTVGYASGLTVYRYGTEPASEAARSVAAPDGLRLLADNTPTRGAAPLRIGVTVPDAAGRLRFDVWDRFGEHVRRVVDESRPVTGPRTVTWDVSDDGGNPLEGGSFLLRVTVDGRSESQIVHITR